MISPIISSLPQAAATLSDNSLFAALPAPSLARLLAKATNECLDSGAVLFHQGEPGSCAYVVIEGDLEVVVDIGSERVQMAILGKGQMVGEIAALSDLPRNATIIARSPTRLLRLEHDHIRSILAEDPVATIGVIAELGKRLTTVNQPLAFLSMAARSLENESFDAEALGAMAEQAGDLGPFARAFHEMVKEIQIKQVFRQDMAMAARIQQSVLPRPFDQIWRPFDIHAYMRPAREVGGDLFDYFMIDDQHLAFAVADVSGKGVPASLFMMMLRTVVKSVAVPGMGADQVLSRANALLAEDNDACMFVTVFLGVLELETGHLSYCNAGHNPPYLILADGGRRELPVNGMAVGMLDGVTYTSDSLVLHPGDLLFLFTDGVTESFSMAHEQYGEQRLETLLDSLRARPVEEIVMAVVDSVDSFAAGCEQFDDITCLALAYHPRTETPA